MEVGLGALDHHIPVYSGRHQLKKLNMTRSRSLHPLCSLFEMCDWQLTQIPLNYLLISLFQWQNALNEKRRVKPTALKKSLLPADCVSILPGEGGSLMVRDILFRVKLCFFHFSSFEFNFLCYFHRHVTTPLYLSRDVHRRRGILHLISKQRSNLPLFDVRPNIDLPGKGTPRLCMQIPI